MMGAKNHCVILPDADPEVALNQLVGAAFGAAGHGYTSVAVMVGEARNWLPDFVERAKKLKVQQWRRPRGRSRIRLKRRTKNAQRHRQLLVTV